MMLVLASPRSARIIAAKLTPVAASRPTPMVVPSGCLLAAMVPALRRADGADRSTIDVPPTGSTKPPAASVVVVEPSTTQLTPRSALLSADDLDDDRLDQHLRAADVELVDDRHQRAHRALAAVMTSALVSGSAQIVALPPSSDSVVGRRPRPAPRLRRAALRRRAAAGICSLSLRRDLLGVGVVQVAHLGVAAAVERRVEVRDQRLDAQALRLLAADEHAVGALVGDDAHRVAGAFAAALAG